MLGETLADLGSGPASRWDRAATLTLKLYSGALQSRGELAVFGGANALALEAADGVWEVLQFETASLTAPNTWQLTGLLRGQLGTESAMAATVPAGARVVLLDGAPKQLGLNAGNYNLPFHWLYGPQGKPLSDPAWQGVALQFSGVGLRPYAPCALSAAYDASGNLQLGWIRRDRAPSADSWDQSEIALSETAEAYDVEIRDGAGAVIRTFASVATPSLTYTAAEIAADFPGGLPGPFRFTVYQLSAAIGRGPGKTAQIHFA